VDEQADPTVVAHFRILERIGQGGMGVVYRAEDETLRRTVALKLLADAGSDEATRKSFLREARSAAAVTHPNVAIVHQIGEAEGHLYIAMELVEGESLRTRMARGRLDVATARDLGVQIACGLAAAHEKGIVHCDLKPENVMITPGGLVKLLDFGLARLGADRPAPTPPDSVRASADPPASSARKRVLGTAEYMSPEQARGKPLDVRSDVFSLGIVLFEMFSGGRPFAAADSRGVMLAIVREPAPRLRPRSSEVDEATEAVVMRCLAKEPGRRFADAGKVLAALSKQSSSAATVSVTAGSPITRAGRLPRATLVGTAALVVTALVTVFVLARHPSQPVAAPSSARARAVTRIVDLPPPRTSVPAAATEYASGIQAMHDDNWDEAGAHFTRAVELDPAMAVAHLRRSMMMVTLGDPVARRAEFTRAVSMRSQLSERDQALMEALQPFLQGQTQDVAETDRRLRALTERHPTDVELWMWRSAVHYFNPESLPAAEHALELDPSDGSSWEFKGDALLAVGKVDEARAAYERCGAVSLDGADCFTFMAREDSIVGRCADFERDARRAADRNPSYIIEVVWAMASNGASAEALDETAAQWIPTIAPSTGPELQRAAFDAQLAILAGDFTRASALTKKQEAILAASPSLGSIYWMHYQLTVQLLDIALETGDDAAVPRIAGAFAARSAAWQRETFGTYGVDLSLYFARLALPTSEPLPSDFEQRRRAWIDERLAAGAYKGEVWNYAYASPALTESDARTALDALRELGPATPTPAVLTSWAGRLGSPEADAGRVYLLAGRVDEAIQHLRRAAAECDILTSTRDHLRASLDLGRALEQNADPAGACEAYGQVLARWGQAKPRSVTTDEARVRSKALGCNPR
jgi:serine/threonine-protein kinase